jgi:FMN phosphatase YigB (HAD superfamily)
MPTSMRAILFDFGGTLDFPRHWLDRFVAHYRAAGICISRSQLEPAFDAATRCAYSAGTRLWEFGLSDLIGYLLAIQFERLDDAGSLESRNLLRVASGPAHSCDLRTQIRDAFVAESVTGFAISRPLLTFLAARFRIGVVSNFYGNLERILAEAELSSAIDTVADSGRLGFYKPDSRLFGVALANLGVSADRAVMVGDSLAKDCVPAHAMGMRTVWLRHGESSRESCPGVVDFTIDRLEGLRECTWLRS